jgi:hypothetical protein
MSQLKTNFEKIKSGDTNYKKAYNETNDVDLKAWIKTWTFNLKKQVKN